MFFILLALIILGLIFGSFGSVIFFRLGDLPNWQTLKGFLIGRSECRHCHHTLHTKDLIPLRSFFSQRGKCRYCTTNLSRWYPLLELGTVLIFVATYLISGAPSLTSGVFRFVAIGLRLLFIIALYDLKEYALHLTATIALLLLSGIGQWVLGYDLLAALQYGLLFFFLFLIIYFLAKLYVSRKYQQKAEGFGFGDVILSGILGSLLAIVMPSTLREQIDMVCIYLILACVLGIVHYGSSLGIYSHHPTIEIAQQGGKIIPFLPAMIVAFVVMMIRGPFLVDGVMSNMESLTLLLYH